MVWSCITYNTGTTKYATNLAAIHKWIAIYCNNRVINDYAYELYIYVARGG